MSILVTISRILVGSLFIVSGLIKANDSLGFSYKLVEYFSPEVLNLEFLIPVALPLAVVISVVEVILGFAVLWGIKMRLASWALLLMIVFFTFLTFYSAYFEKVTDCGCFGDAIKLTPWQSFTKDVVLLVLVLIIFGNRGRITPNTPTQDKVILPIAFILITLFSVGMLSWNFPWIFTVLLFGIFLGLKALPKLPLGEWPLVVLVTVCTSGFTLYTLNMLPVRDFRPYAEGKSISEGMKSAEELGLKPPQYDLKYIFTNVESGEDTVILSSDYLKVYDKPWFKDRYEVKNWDGGRVKTRDGYEPPIHDFVITDADGNDVTADLLSAPAAWLVVAYDLEHTCEDVFGDELNDLYALAQSKGEPIYVLTSSTYNEIQELKHATQSMLDFYSADAITLKTIVRSNPGVVRIENGVVKGKWHYHNFPDWEED